ncbi:MAG: AbrB/MazE/SpoVT family DNA-binding domain-containing protein [Dehalococcoidia bacterium]
MDTFESSVRPKGQVTLPRELRRRWGIKPKDRVTFCVDADTVIITRARSSVEESFGAVPPLSQTLTVEEMTEIAAAAHARAAVENDRGC